MGKHGNGEESRIDLVVSNGPFQSVIKVERGNPELQDFASVVELGSALLAVLADGAGGRSNAREAAEAVVRTVCERARGLDLTDPAVCAVPEPNGREPARIDHLRAGTKGLEALISTSVPHRLITLPSVLVIMFALVLVAISTVAAPGKWPEDELLCQQDDGYRGIWYMNQPSKDEYRYKYSGGFATYPQQHAPIAIYRKEVNKTFFCYGGTTARTGHDKQELLHMVSFFDHATGEVPRPTILLNKHTDDAHDNPTLSIDDRGFIWIFSAAHGTARPSYIHRSLKPYSIDRFVRVLVTNFSYTQPWWLPEQGFIFLHTRYAAGRNLFWMTSKDGAQWNAAQPLAKIEMGDYQVSWPRGNCVATAFDYHPAPVGLNARANIYFLQTCDIGKTWVTTTGAKVSLPITNTANPALVYDSRAQGLLVYLKDLNFDAVGNPVILFLTSKGFESGPKNDPRTWRTAHWTGKQWQFKTFTASDNNYDHGSLYIEPDGTWRIIAPTATGPQPYNPGGEMVMWISSDRGDTWTHKKQLTRNSSRNHTYARRPLDAHPDFYALWADGHAREPSESHLYFTNQKGDHVWRLPAKMDRPSAKPEVAW